MGLNKFITKKGRVLLDLTEDTVTPETLGKGVTAHDRSGEPIVGTMEGGGGGGECSGVHINVVDQLPEVGEVGNVYKCQGKYYEWFHGFTDVLFYFIQQFVPIGTLLAELAGIAFKAHTIPTKTTEGVLSPTDAEMHFYYIEDENDVFIYANGSWVSFANTELNYGGGTYGGVINDISEATDTTKYYAFFASYWIEYAVPVSVPTTYTVQTVAELPTDAVKGSFAIVIGGE